MKRILVAAVLGLMAMACGDECDDAVDKLEECGFTGGDSDSDEECEGAAECVAKCINDAECSDITMPTADSAYTQCVNACAG